MKLQVELKFTERKISLKNEIESQKIAIGAAAIVKTSKQKKLGLLKVFSPRKAAL